MDDQLFSSLRELDDLDQVRPATGDALTAYPFRQCVRTGTIFSPQDYLVSHLARTIDLLDSAQWTLDIAMYSFRDGGVFDALNRAIDRGVSVRLVSNSAAQDRKSPEGTRSAELEDHGAEVRWINKTMHHKYVLVDGPREEPGRADTATVATGSGNWSYSAGTRFDENTVFIRGDRRLALQLQAEFNHLWENSRPVVWNEDIQTVWHKEISQDWIDAARGADTVFTSSNFETYESARYGATFTRREDSAVAQDALVEFISSAQVSVDIASGHLRSQAISQAILDLASQAPWVTIRVYLDSQEHTGESYYRGEIEEIETCLARAGYDPSDVQECQEKGAHFGYALYEAGVDLRYKYYGYRWHYYYAAQMHHKYVVVDGERVASGSYNFSPNAEWNTLENLVFYDSLRYPDLVQDFQVNFDAIWDTGAELYAPLLDEIVNGTGEVPLIFDSMALTWDEIAAVREGIEAHCRDLEVEAFRTQPWVYQDCPRR
jgi:phosphatidylserine/phosphatidylglycerophosphate/cardiolipin synthase-like enzyme